MIQGVAVDDIRSFVMPDDASMLALQQGPYWTRKSLKYIDVDVFPHNCRIFQDVQFNLHLQLQEERKSGLRGT